MTNNPPASPESRLDKQLRFILELDKLKSVERRSILINRSRRENAAEHSWHVAMMASLLAEHAEDPVDVPRVVMMLLVHDIVELDAGDTYVYDDEAVEKQAERERIAADRLFGLLPEEQGMDLRTLWEEYDARNTPDSRFAATIDRLMPLLHNVYTEGASWQDHEVSAQQVRERNAEGRPGSEKLWAYAETLIQQAVEQGELNP
jgi:putative hydrolase of HD superfamily